MELASLDVWIGLTNQNGPLVPLMTRKLAKVVINSEYDVSNYVKRCNRIGEVILTLD
jgi:hypothetical protein